MYAAMCPDCKAFYYRKDGHSCSGPVAVTKCLRWTKERPTEPGWYWTRNKDHPDSARTREILRDEFDRLVSPVTGCDELYLTVGEFSDAVQWAGPIPMPEEEP